MVKNSEMVKDFLLKDLTFSCRIQSKRVEHAFLHWFMQKIHDEYGRYPRVVYNKTERNSASGKVFEDFGFTSSESVNGVLEFSESSTLPDDNLIEIIS